MKLKPSENTKLYGMSHFFNEITDLYNKKKNAYKNFTNRKKGTG